MKQLPRPSLVAAVIAVSGLVIAGVAFAATLSVTSADLTIFSSNEVPPAPSPSNSPSPTASSSPSPQACTVTFRSVSGNNTSGSTLSIPRPSGLAVGDVMVAHIVRLSGTRSMTPSGWTLIQAVNHDLGHHLYYKVATSADTTAASFSWSVAEKASGSILAYSGVDTTTPLNGTVPTALTGDSTTANAPAISPATSTGMRLAFHTIKKNTTLSQPTGMVQRYLRRNSDAAFSLAGSEQLLGTSGATNAKASTAGEQDKWAGHSVALRAAVTC